MDKKLDDKIMLINPDFDFTSEFADRLSRTGFDVLVANDAATAFKLLQISQPTLILLDILMKGDDGKDLLATLKDDAATSGIPVIILTSDADVNTIVYSFLQGANDYIAKPFVFPEILARINNQIKIVNMQKELELKNKELMKKNALLEQMAITDSLTGLYNKGYLLKRLESEILRAVRYNEITSLIIMDIDNFKEINDTHGHLFGDKVLKDISKLISDSVRDVDITARYGGDEFFVVCPNTDVNGAKILAERIRSSIENHKLKLENTSVSVSLSFGISSIGALNTSRVKPSLKKLINEADIALYRAKSAGRNRIEVYSNKAVYTDMRVNHGVKTLMDNTCNNANKYTH